MRTICSALFAHDLSHRRSAWHSVDGPRKVELLLDCPEFIMLIRGEQPGWIPCSDPADGDSRLRRESRIDVKNTVDSKLGAGARDGAGEHRHTGGDEDFVGDTGSIQVRMRTDEHRITDVQGGSPAVHGEQRSP